MSDISRACFDPANSLLSVDATRGRIFSAALMFRGHVPAGELAEAVQEAKLRRSVQV